MVNQINTLTNAILEIINCTIEDKVANMAVPQNTSKPVYSNKEMMALLDVDAKTLKKYRDDGLIGFSRVNDKIYYTSNDLVTFLNRTHIKPYQYEK